MSSTNIRVGGVYDVCSFARLLTDLFLEESEHKSILTMFNLIGPRLLSTFAGELLRAEKLNV